LNTLKIDNIPGRTRIGAAKTAPLIAHGGLAGDLVKATADNASRTTAPDAASRCADLRE
jgi:hypothetical protein